MTYGINNKSGIPSEREIGDLLKYANQHGINTLDTAYNYGESEKRIGEILENNKLDFKIISKAPKIIFFKIFFLARFARRSHSKYSQNFLLGSLRSHVSLKRNSSNFLLGSLRSHVSL